MTLKEVKNAFEMKGSERGKNVEINKKTERSGRKSGVVSGKVK